MKPYVEPKAWDWMTRCAEVWRKGFTGWVQYGDYRLRWKFFYAVRGLEIPVPRWLWMAGQPKGGWDLAARWREGGLL